MADLNINGASMALQYRRTRAIPLDSTDTWKTLAEARQYAQNIDSTPYQPYNGQIISVLENNETYKLVPDNSISTEDGKAHYRLEEIASTNENNDKYVRRDIPETLQELLTLLKGIDVKGNATLEAVEVLNNIVSKGFTAGNNGFGIYKDEQGIYHLDIDMVDVRRRLNVQEIMVEESTYVGGRTYTTVGSGITCSSVEIVGNAYRCRFKASDETGVVVRNKFAVGDMAIHETFNLKSGTRFYWREVVGVGEDYIDLSISGCASGSDIPQTGDDICHLGNISNPKRQGAIVNDAITAGGPYVRVYNRIGANPESRYALPTPLIDLNPSSSVIKAKLVNEATGKDVNDELNQMRVDFGVVKEQIDREFTIWFFDYIPTLSNEPAVDWITDDLKELHVQDLFYNTKDGFAYRFEYDEVMARYYWRNITDAETIKALENAAKAQAAADSKMRVFVEQPTNDSAYDVGDQWLNATYSDENVSYNNDSLVCIQSKAKGEAFSISHWQPSSTATTAYLENLGNEIVLAVTDLSNGIQAAQQAANEARTSAQQAIVDAGAAYALASSADDYISALSVTAQDIVGVVKGTKFDENGDITNLSALVLEDTFSTLLNQKIEFDSNGKIKATSTSGLVVSSDFANLFSQQVTAQEVVVRSEIKTFVKKNDDGTLESGVTIKADQIEMLGTIVANGTFVVDKEGNLTLNNITATSGKFTGEVNATSGTFTGVVTAGDYYQMKINPSDEGYPSLKWMVGEKFYSWLGLNTTGGYLSGEIDLFDLVDRQIIITPSFVRQRAGDFTIELNTSISTSASITISKDGTSHNLLAIGLDSNGLPRIGSQRWPTSANSVQVGEMYLDGNTLKVRTD